MHHNETTSLLHDLLDVLEPPGAIDAGFARHLASTIRGLLADLAPAPDIAPDEGSSYPLDMCRNIRVLHNFEPAATDDEVYAAALQYVRKVSGSTRPSKANQAAFEHAVAEIAHLTRHLLEDLVTTAPAKDREAEATKAKERSAKRFATA